MNKFKVIIFLAAVVFVNVSCKDDDDDMDNQISSVDRTFVLNAADGGMFEVKAGEMAVAKGDTTSMGHMMGSQPMSVKTFGQMMITDHTTANNELMTLASKKSVTIPTTLTTAKQQKLDSLTALSGKAFNAAYAKMMVSSHQETINLFQTEAASGADGDLKSFASGKIPILQGHLQMATMLQDSIK